MTRASLTQMTEKFTAAYSTVENQFLAIHLDVETFRVYILSKVALKLQNSAGRHSSVTFAATDSQKQKDLNQPLLSSSE